MDEVTAVIDGILVSAHLQEMLRLIVLFVTSIFSASLLWDAFNIQFGVFYKAAIRLRLATAFIEVAALAVIAQPGTFFNGFTLTVELALLAVIASLAVIIRWIRNSPPPRARLKS